jgi:hypothetical protein
VQMAKPMVIENPRVAFVNLAGAACAGIANEDRATIGSLFGSNLQAGDDLAICDVLFLYCEFDEHAKIVGVETPLRGLIRDSQARVVVVASESRPGLFSDPERQKQVHQNGNPAVNLVIALNRNGDTFGRFFRSLFEMMWSGSPMPLAWIALAPQGPAPADRTLPGTLCLMEAGPLVFARREPAPQIAAPVGFEVQDVLSFRTMNEGELGLIDFKRSDDGIVQLRLPYYLLPNLASVANQLGIMSEQKRYARPGEAGKLEIVQAFSLLADPVLRRGAAGRITMHLRTGQGFPMAIELSPDQAEALGQALLAPPNAPDKAYQ